jgi:hypothetical protein
MTEEQANVFAGTFAFLPTIEPTQKNQKSLQATAQGQCRFDTTALRPKRTTTHNSSYPKVAVQWLHQALCFYQSLCLVDSEVLRNRHLRVAAKRLV